MKEKKVTIENLDLFYVDNEKGGIPLVMIHGNSLNSNLFSYQYKSNELNGFRIIAMDLPGHGKSGRSTNPEKDYAVSTYVRVLTTFIQNMGLDELVLFGHSLGGHIAIHVANQLKNVKGLVITGTPPLTAPPKLEEAFKANPALPLAFKPDLSGEEIKQLVNAFITDNGTGQHLVNEAILMSDPLVRPFIGKSISTEVNEDEAEILRNADFPIAAFHGENDSLVNVDYINKLGLDLWGGKVQIIEKSGHSAFLEDAKEFNDLLKNFIEDL